MSTLFRSHARNLGFKGFASDIYYFLLYGFMWCLGYAFGICIVLLGVRLGDTGKIKDDEMDELVRIMNEEGPNN